MTTKLWILIFKNFTDGTSQQVSYAKKVVTLTKHDNYKLVLTNYYNNQTVDVSITGEIRTFEDRSKGTTLGFSYILIIIIIILVVVIIVLGFTIHKYKRAEGKELDKVLGKKAKKDKPKKGKDKDKRSAKKEKSKKAKSEAARKPTKAQGTPSDFCGYCGKPVDSPFCKHCGRKV